jgi:PAS domain S-box-containing protein
LFIDVNEKFLQMTGYARNEVIGFSSFELGLWADDNIRKHF